MSALDEPRPDPAPFDFDSFPEDTLFHDRREGRDRRAARAPQGPARDATPRPPIERRAKKERRRRIDPTTFEKQYTDDELEFMNAMQRFKVQSGKSFPSHGDVLRVAAALGYRRPAAPEVDDLAGQDCRDDAEPSDSTELLTSAGPL